MRILSADPTSARPILAAMLLAPLLLGPFVAGAATLHGRVWSDQNGNGRRDTGEPGLAGVTVYVDSNFNGSLDPGESLTVSMRDSRDTTFDEGGLYWLETNSGRQAVRSLPPAEAQPTFPRDGHFLSVGHSTVVNGLDFGFLENIPGSVHGRIWQDQNQDGIVDPSEGGLPNVTVYADENANCVLDRGEPVTRSMQDDPATAYQEAGHYWLEDLDPGPRSIRIVQPSGQIPIFPIGAAHEAFVPSDGATEGWDFGNRDLQGFSSTAPQRIDLSGPIGDTIDTSVSLSIAPYCFRAYDVTLAASDPGASVTNLSGTQINGCGGDTSVFDVRFTIPAERQCFQLEFVDADYGGVLGSIPVTLVPEPALGSMLLSGSLGLGWGALRRTRRR